MKNTHRKPLPWPVLFAMYRAACSPRIFVRPGGRMRIELDDKCALYASQVTDADGNGYPTILVECGPNGTDPGELTVQYPDTDGTP